MPTPTPQPAANAQHAPPESSARPPGGADSTTQLARPKSVPGVTQYPEPRASVPAVLTAEGTPRDPGRVVRRWRRLPFSGILVRFFAWWAGLAGFLAAFSTCPFCGQQGCAGGAAGLGAFGALAAIVFRALHLPPRRRRNRAESKLVCDHQQDHNDDHACACDPNHEEHDRHDHNHATHRARQPHP